MTKRVVVFAKFEQHVNDILNWEIEGVMITFTFIFIGQYNCCLVKSY